MQILFLTPYPPYPPHGGGRQRMYQMLRWLSERHNVWCLSLSASPEESAAAAPLAELCHVMFFPAPERSLWGRATQTFTTLLPDLVMRSPSQVLHQAVEALTSEQHFDVVQAESLEMAQYALEIRRRVPLTVVDEFNAEYVLQRRAAMRDLRRITRLHAGMYSMIQWPKLARYERRVARLLDRVIVVSKEDRAALRRLSRRTKPVIIPNGVDTSYFRPADQPPNDDALLFTGTMDFRPNVDAVGWFVNEILPLIREQRPAYLRIVGRSPLPAVQALARPAIVDVVGPVDDIRDSFAATAVYVVPMRFGGGVRLKVLEALASGLPVVSTTMGAEGIEGLRDGEHCLIADTPQAFAAAVVRLLEDRALGQRLGRAGCALVRQHYDWQAVLPDLESVYAPAQRRRRWFSPLW